MMDSGILDTLDLTALPAPAPGHSPRPALTCAWSGWSSRSWPRRRRPPRASAPPTTSRRRGRPRGQHRAAPATCPREYVASTQVTRALECLINVSQRWKFETLCVVLIVKSSWSCVISLYYINIALCRVYFPSQDLTSTLTLGRVCHLRLALPPSSHRLQPGR